MPLVAVIGNIIQDSTWSHFSSLSFCIGFVNIYRFIVPESALFLVEKGKLEQAYISVSKATGLSTENSKVIEQIELIQNSVNSNRESGSASIKEFFSFKNRIFIGWLLEYPFRCSNNLPE